MNSQGEEYWRKKLRKIGKVREAKHAVKAGKQSASGQEVGQTAGQEFSLADLARVNLQLRSAGVLIEAQPKRQYKLPMVKAKTFSLGPTEDLQEWLRSCEVYFEANAWLWKEERQCIHYAAALCEGMVKDWAMPYTKQMDGTYNIAKVEEFCNWANWVIQMKKPFISRDEVREAKDKFRNIKYSNIEEYLGEVFLLNLTIGRRGTDWRDEVLSRVALKLRERMSEQVKRDDEAILRAQLLEVGMTWENFQWNEQYLVKESFQPPAPPPPSGPRGDRHHRKATGT